jgi:hypothetical protein
MLRDCFVGFRLFALMGSMGEVIIKDWKGSPARWILLCACDLDCILVECHAIRLRRPIIVLEVGRRIEGLEKLRDIEEARINAIVVRPLLAGL